MLCVHCRGIVLKDLVAIDAQAKDYNGTVSDQMVNISKYRMLWNQLTVLRRTQMTSPVLQVDLDHMRILRVCYVWTYLYYYMCVCVWLWFAGCLREQWKDRWWVGAAVNGERAKTERLCIHQQLQGDYSVLYMYIQHVHCIFLYSIPPPSSFPPSLPPSYPLVWRTSSSQVLWVGCWEADISGHGHTQQTCQTDGWCKLVVYVRKCLVSYWTESLYNRLFSVLMTQTTQVVLVRRSLIPFPVTFHS